MIWQQWFSKGNSMSSPHLGFHRIARHLALAFAVMTCSAQLRAETPEIFKDADLALGSKLMTEHKCNACHQQKVEGDGSAIYRPAGRINSPGLLRGMVEQCNTQLTLSLFPEEVTAISAVLNRDHYKFKK